MTLFYYCIAACSFHLDGYTDFIFSRIDAYSNQSYEHAIQKIQMACDERPNSDGNLYWVAYHGGPDNQRTLATIENSCSIR